MNMLTCIYCEKEYLKEDLSKSDIIPFAFLAGEKLTLNSKVCKICNNLVNKNAEQTIIKEFESLRRRINVTQRRGQLIKNQFVIEYENDDIKLRTNPIKAIEPETILTKPMYFKDENDKGVIIGPYEKTMEIASSKGDGEKVAKLEITNNFSIYESYSVPMESFFSKEMKTMVAKICYEWLIKISPELNPFEKTYKNIRESIYKDKVDKEGIVDVITNREIAKGLFEDLSHLKDLKETEYVPKRLVVGDYYLFFEIKNGGYYCFFAFMGLIKSATFIDSNACIENIEYYEDRRLDKNLILKLANGVYIQDYHNIILKGPTGSGKSFIATAFGVSACRQFYKVKYIRLPELLDELLLAKLSADGSYRKLIKKYAKVNLLILDEWLLTELTTDEATILLEITESRHKVASTIFCSQIDPSGWHTKLGNETIAEAILDRIIHDSYQILIDGEISMRERYGIGK